MFIKAKQFLLITLAGLAQVVKNKKKQKIKAKQFLLITWAELAQVVAGVEDQDDLCNSFAHLPSPETNVNHQNVLTFAFTYY